MSFEAYGYSIVFLSNIATAIYLATIARIGTMNFFFYLKTFLVCFTSFIIFLKYTLKVSVPQGKPVALTALALCGAMVSLQILI